MIDELIQKHNDLFDKVEKLSAEMNEVSEDIIEKLSSMPNDERDLYLAKIKDIALKIGFASSILQKNKDE